MGKRICSILFAICMLFIMTISYAGAIGLDDIDETTTTVQETKSNSSSSSSVKASSSNGGKTAASEGAEGVADVLEGVGGITKGDMEKAQQYSYPVVKIINTVVAVISGCLFACATLFTMLDLVYLTVPPLRKFLGGGEDVGDPSQQVGAMNGGMHGGMNGGFGGMNGGFGGAYGGGYGGYGGYNRGGAYGGGYGGGFGQQGMNQPNGAQGVMYRLGRWTSDSVVQAIKEGNGSNKSHLVIYAKKRAVFFVLLAVCVIVFTSTALTDWGMKLGVWIVELIGKAG